MYDLANIKDRKIIQDFDKELNFYESRKLRILGRILTGYQLYLHENSLLCYSANYPNGAVIARNIAKYRDAEAKYRALCDLKNKRAFARRQETLACAQQDKNNEKTAQITINGRIYSKKNSKQIRQNTQTQKVFLTASDAYLAAKESLVWQCRAACKIRFTEPVHVVYNFRIQGNYDIDVDNAMATINDALQESGVIDDDKNIISGSFSKKKNQKDWTTKITIKTAKNIL